LTTESIDNPKHSGRTPQMPPKGKGNNKRGNWNNSSKNATLDMTQGAAAMNLFSANPVCGNPMFPQQIPAAGMAALWLRNR